MTYVQGWSGAEARDCADTAADLDAGAGAEDVLDIGVFDFADLAAAQAAATRVGGDVVIVLDGDDGVPLLDVPLSDLHQDDFIFSI